MNDYRFERQQREAEDEIRRDPQLYIYVNHPTKYAEYADRVSLYMRVSDMMARRGCDGNGCDVDAACPRHSRLTEIAERWRRRYGK